MLLSVTRTPRGYLAARQTDRQKDRQTDREIDRERDRERQRGTERDRDREKESVYLDTMSFLYLGMLIYWALCYYVCSRLREIERKERERMSERERERQILIPCEFFTLVC